ncbi:MAG TPA: citrate synthase [Stellaceae bacterium]|jgi:citrate synthase|nr:citrate synthase [Stellaceae bacterium]
MKPGLEGVIAAETVLTHVDGARGIWWLRGHSLGELVADHGFEGAVALLWDGFAGEGLTRDDILATLGDGRIAAFERLPHWLAAAGHRPLSEAMRLLFAAIPEGSTPGAIAAAVPVGLAALIRGRAGEPPVAPDPALTTAADFLRMAAGAPASAASAAALDAYLTTVVDNGLAASTFAARVIASTRASLAAAVLGGYCALTGPLHGGAPGPVLDMLDEIGSVDKIDAWLEQALARADRLMGFGHRVWKRRDPRADALKATLRRLGPDAGRIAFAEEVERRAIAALHRLKPDRVLETNVDFYTSLLLEAIGLPRDAFTPVFALARTPGWLAHALEQQKTGRLIRPAAAYIGPHPHPRAA